MFLQMFTGARKRKEGTTFGLNMFLKEILFKQIHTRPGHGA